MSFFSSQPAWWQRAQQQGLVHGDAPAESADEEPGVFVIVLALIGAFVCAIAAGGFLVTLIDTDFWYTNPASYVLSLIGMIGSAMMLSRIRGVFVTCLALVLWGLFCGLFLIRLSYDVSDYHSDLLMFSGLLALQQLVGAAVVQAQWIKRIMGFVFGIALHLFLVRCSSTVIALYMFDVAGVLLAGAWIFWLRSEPQRLARVRERPALAGWAAFADSAAVALLCMVVFGFAFGGTVFGLAYELLGAGDLRNFSESSWRTLHMASRFLASALVLVATALLYMHWKKAAMVTRQTLVTVLGLGALLAVAAWFSPALGVIALMSAGALMGGRWRIAVLCGLAALWSLSAFYYSLTWTLAQKGLGLAIMGAVLLAGLFLQRALAAREHADGGNLKADADGFAQISAWSKPRLWCLIAGAVLVFGLVNWDVRGKEQVIANGKPVLVQLVPVDPRSLMQGDYMALRFELPQTVRDGLNRTMLPVARVRASLNDRGEARVLGLVADGDTRASDEIILPLKKLKGDWVLVTDAYFFPEGTGKVFERAKYGDFRVLPDGRALLVGLADKDGQPIPVPRAKAAVDTSAAASDSPEGDWGQATEAVETTGAAIEPPPEARPSAPAN